MGIKIKIMCQQIIKIKEQKCPQVYVKNQKNLRTSQL